MRKLKAGIVGCGGIANGKHLPAMKKSGLYEIVAFCDIIRERAEKAKKEYGTEDAKVFEDYQELIKEDLDVVYVTTPNRSHAEISIAAMEAGKDVMCEKPMAKNYAEAGRLSYLLRLLFRTDLSWPHQLPVCSVPRQLPARSLHRFSYG